VCGHASFELGLVGWGVFPNRDRPRVLWLGCAEPVAPMVALADAVARALEPLGFAREVRPFHPHLTLARLREPWLDDALVRRLNARATQPLGRMQVEELHLYESRLHPTGAEYQRRGSYRLVG
ncbi:MAG: RNA 2',3'-cyclic phosphodiesterase, partial [Verrucomicrobiae bacterium]|nr:RNA 2',3'-cyclic phosphodiesterase [Verrucomicrobiae bacterium]